MSEAADRSTSPNSRSVKSSGKSKKPSRFGAKDFEKKKNNISPSKNNAAAIAKLRGTKLDVKAYTNKEVVSNFNIIGKFTVPDKQSAGIEGVYLANYDNQKIYSLNLPFSI